MHQPLPLLTKPDHGGGVPKWPFVLAGIIFFALLALVNYFADRSLEPETAAVAPVKTTPPLEVNLELSSTPSDLPAGWAIYFDPTLMALPNEQSYSKSYLLQRPPLETPSFDLSVKSPPYQFPRPYFRSSGVAVPSKAGSWSRQNPIVRLTTAESQASETPPNSMVGLFGDLRKRPLVNLPEFPKVTSSDLLMPGEYLIGADASGTVQMVILERSCGDDKTDDLGYQLARNISFIPDSRQKNRLAWGLLKVSWVVTLRPTKL